MDITWEAKEFKRKESVGRHSTTELNSLECKQRKVDDDCIDRPKLNCTTQDLNKLSVRGEDLELESLQNYNEVLHVTDRKDPQIVISSCSIESGLVHDSDTNPSNPQIVATYREKKRT